MKRPYLWSRAKWPSIVPILAFPDMVTLIYRMIDIIMLIYLTVTTKFVWHQSFDLDNKLSKRFDVLICLHVEFSKKIFFR